VLHDSEAYFSALKTELIDQGLPFVGWNIRERFDMFSFEDEPPVGLFYNRVTACGCQEHKASPYMTQIVLQWLKKHRRQVINGEESVKIMGNKLYAQTALQSCSLQVPPSTACLSKDKLMECARRYDGHKFIIEPNRRRFGTGVSMFSSIEELSDFLSSPEYIPSYDGIDLVQSYVKGRTPFTTRIEFVGRQLLYALRVDVSRGLERLVPGYVGDFHAEKTTLSSSLESADGKALGAPRFQVLTDYEHPIVPHLQRFMELHDIEVCSFEFTEDANGDVWIFEVDICSTFNAAAEYRAQLPKAGVVAIVNYLRKRLDLLQPIRAKVRGRPDADLALLGAARKKPRHASKVVILDGGMGRELKRRGANVPDDLWSARALLDQPKLVQDCHKDFILAGARLIITNTYACTPIILGKGGLESRMEELLVQAYDLANQARVESGVKGVKIAMSVPPLVESYRPDLCLPDEEMEAHYTRMVTVLKDKADVFLCETMSCAREARAAAKACLKTGKPVWTSFVLSDDASARLCSGENLQTAMAAVKDLDIAAFLFNCSLPESIDVALPVLRELTTKPLGAMPNCFAPIPTDWTLESKGFRTLRQDLSPVDVAGYARGWVDNGMTLVGGCCGIGPEHIEGMNCDLHLGGDIAKCDDKGQ